MPNYGRVLCEMWMVVRLLVTLGCRSKQMTDFSCLHALFSYKEKTPAELHSKCERKSCFVDLSCATNIDRINNFTLHQIQISVQPIFAISLLLFPDFVKCPLQASQNNVPILPTHKSLQSTN